LPWAFWAWVFELWLGLWLDSFGLGFLVWEAFGREKNYYREIAEGKSMAKEGLIESLHRERSLT
jgi:hypothetical protein